MHFEDDGPALGAAVAEHADAATRRACIPGGCLLEGTKLSEGRGTTRPFEIWGAPWVDGAALARDVHVEGAVLRPLTFEPTFHKHAEATCGGVQVHVVDDAIASARTRRICACSPRRFAQRPNEPKWRTETYEYVSDRPAIDLLTGGPEYREAVEAGRSLDDVLDAEREGAEAFTREREPFLLYRA